MTRPFVKEVGLIWGSCLVVITEWPEEGAQSQSVCVLLVSLRVGDNSTGHGSDMCQR